MPLASGDHISFEREDLVASLVAHRDMFKPFFRLFELSLNQLSLLHTSAEQYLESLVRGMQRGDGYFATRCARYDEINKFTQSILRMLRIASRYLTDCGFDQKVVGAFERYVEVDEILESSHGLPSPDWAEEF